MASTESAPSIQFISSASGVGGRADRSLDATLGHTQSDTIAIIVTLYLPADLVIVTVLLHSIAFRIRVVTDD
jgi:hypothetical protein